MGEKINVVIADDQPELRMLLRAMLQRSVGEYEFDVVAEAANGREAVDAVNSFHPDMLILDLAMPEMDGLQALAEIRQTDTPVIVVILTGFDGVNLEHKTKNMGANAYLQKGTGITQLCDTLAGLLKSRA